MTPDSKDGIDKGVPQSAHAAWDGWGWIASLAAGTPRQPISPVSDAFADRVLSRLAANPVSTSWRPAERLVLLTASGALAAALLLAAWSWPEISIALGDLPLSVDTPVRVEPWL